MSVDSDRLRFFPKNDQTQQKATETQMAETEQDTSLEDGEYTANVKLEGGSGRASVDSEAKNKSDRRTGICNDCLEQFPL